MALTKIKRGGLDTGITDNSDANALTFDSSENATFAGTISSGAITSTGDLTVDTNTLFVDASENTVGIGTTSPDGTLHAHTASAGSVSANANADDLVVENSGIGGISILTPDANSARLYFGSASDNDYGRIIGNYNSGSPYLTLRTSVADTLVITSGGDVGIGTTSPRISTAWGSTNSKYLTVTNGSTGPGILTLSADRSGTGQGIGRIEFANANNADASNNDADGKTIASITSNLITSDSNSGDDSGGEIQIHTKPEAGSLTEAMRIDSSGNVGIGTTSPTAGGASGTPKLHVNGAVRIDGNVAIAPGSSTPYISGGSVSTIFRNNANNASLITILNNGNTTFSGNVALGGASIVQNGLNVGGYNQIGTFTSTDANKASMSLGVSGDSQLFYLGTRASMLGSGEDHSIGLYADINNNGSIGLEFYVGGTASGKKALTLDSSQNATFGGRIIQSEGYHQYSISGSTGGEWSERANYRYFAYTKIGRLVHVQGKFETDGYSGTRSGELRISMPFAQVSNLTDNADYTCGSCTINRIGSSAISGQITPILTPGSDQVTFLISNESGGTESYLQASDVDSHFEGQLSIWYIWT